MGREVPFDVPSKIYPVAAGLCFGVLGAMVPRWLGAQEDLWMLGGILTGILVGLTIGTRLIGTAVRIIGAQLSRVSLAGALAGSLGLLFGLAVSALGAIVYRQVYGRVEPALLPAVLAVVAGSILLAHAKRLEFLGLWRPAEVLPERSLVRSPAKISSKVLDTSAIIDGRIADICKTGFLEGILLVPGFVLAELQRIADSSDTLKRNRGRRGLDILNRMQKEGIVSVKICDRDFEDLTEVDTKIVRLARMLEAKVVTNDFNLNKVAELYGVPVLNINELSNAIKPIVLPGEEMFVHVIKDGKEFGQGIGYLEDGTMVVVDGGRQYIGENIDVLVTSVLQTAAGRMIFGKPKEQIRQPIAQNQ